MSNGINWNAMAVVAAISVQLAAGSYWAGKIGERVASLEKQIVAAIVPTAEQVAKNEAELARSDLWRARQEQRITKLETTIEMVQRQNEKG